MKKTFLLWLIIGFGFFFPTALKANIICDNGSDKNDDAKQVGLIGYDELVLNGNIVEGLNVSIVSFRMIDENTVAVLSNESQQIMVFSLSAGRLLYSVPILVTAIDFEYHEGLFHVISDGKYFVVDSNGNTVKEVNIAIPKRETFIITDMCSVDGTMVFHEANSSSWMIVEDNFVEIDSFYSYYNSGFKSHSKYIDEDNVTVFYQTPRGESGAVSLFRDSMGLEGRLACLSMIDINDEGIALNLQTINNSDGPFVKSYLVLVDFQGRVKNTIEIPINFTSSIPIPFQAAEGAWYYAFSGEEGVYFYRIESNTNRLLSPNPARTLPSLNDLLLEREYDNVYESPYLNSANDWRTITQAWYNGHKYITMSWTPISSNIATSCYNVSGNQYIKTHVSNTSQQTGVPYKWGGFTKWTDFESYAAAGKKTGNKHCGVNDGICDGYAVYSSVSDSYVVGVDCSGFVSRCWEIPSKQSTQSIPSICTSYGSVVTNYNSTSLFRKADALNKNDSSGGHVMMYWGRDNNNRIQVFESCGGYWKTVERVHPVYDFTDYVIQRYDNMKNIILRLPSDMTLSQNGQTVTNTVTQGQPLSVSYSVQNAGSESWTGNVSLYIETSAGNLYDIQDNNNITIAPGTTQNFTFNNTTGVTSPLGTTRLYVKLMNVNAGGDGRKYDAGSLTNANPKEFQIVAGGGGGSNCNDCPSYDQTISISGNNVWSTFSSSIASGGCRTYRITNLSTNYSYTFQTCDNGSATFDTRLYLYDGSCNEVAYNDDYGSGTQSSITFTPTSSGVYYLKVDGYGSAHGNFVLAVSRSSGSGGGGGGSGEITTCKSCPEYDESWIFHTGVWEYDTVVLGSNGCYIYRVPLGTSFVHTFQTCNHGSADFDTRLYLYDSDCNLVASNDDYSGSLQSSIDNYRPNNTGYHFLKVDGYGNNSGTFRLALYRINIQPPTITTNQISNVGATTATCGGNVTDSGSIALVGRGVCWSTSQNPTVSDDHTNNGNGLGSFTSQMTGLTPNTTYYVRAYASNAAHTAYGEQRTFTTSDNVSQPTVTTNAVSSVTSTTATCGGNVTATGGSTVTARGVCWSTSQNPTISGSHTTDGSGSASFTSSITGLSPNTTYYVRAYATNSAGTGYGTQRSFTTSCNTVNVSISGNTNINQGQSTTLTASGASSYLWNTGSTNSSITVSPSTTTTYSVTGTNSYGCTGTESVTVTVNIINAPAVTTNTVSDVTSTAATCGGNVTSTGGSAVTARGVCWSTSQNPTISGSYTTDGSGSGSFTSSITGLSPNTTYYVRAYATNSAGTGYGTQRSFTTSCNTVNVSISGNTNINQGQSTTLTASGASSYLWNTGSTNSSITVSPSTTTTYSVTGTNSYGCTGTGSVTVTVNIINAPTVTTNTVSDVTSTAATCGGNVTSTGGSAVTARGVCWSTSQNPTISGSHTTDGSGSGSFTSSITGLSPNTTYYVRAYATNSAGTGYGTQRSFTTSCNTVNVSISGNTNINQGQNTTLTASGASSYLWNTGSTSSSITVSPNTTTTYSVTGTNSYGCTGTESVTVTVNIINAPTVTTNTVSDVTSTAATCGGNVTSTGGSAVTARGVCWSTSQNPTISGSHTTDGSGSGSFTSSITGLSPNTTYYVRAYATNDIGTNYGDQHTFTTSCDVITGVEVIVACDSCTWHGTTYTESTNTPTYTCQNADGCDSVTYLNLTINYSVTTYDTILLTAAELPYYYHGVVINMTGDYTLTLTTHNNCDSIVLLHAFVDRTNVEGIEETISVQIHPNPTSGMVSITSDREILYVEVYNINGKKEMTQYHSTIDLAQLPVGMYTLRIVFADSCVIDRVIKK